MPSLACTGEFSDAEKFYLRAKNFTRESLIADMIEPRRVGVSVR